MIVYEITKEYAPVFEDFVPKHILQLIGKPGFHTLGEVFTTDEDYYPSGFLQFYDGSQKKDHEAVITYLFVPEEERGEANAWSLLSEMERRLRDLDVKKIGVKLAGGEIDVLKSYFILRGFKDRKDAPEYVTAEVDAFLSEKLLAMPDNDSVQPLKKESKKEISRVMMDFGEKILNTLNIDADIHSDSFSMDLSMIYHDKDTEGLFLITMLPEGGLNCRMLRSKGGHSQKAMLEMLAAAVRILKKMKATGIPVYIPCYNDKTLALIKTLNPDIDLKPVWQGECEYV